MENSINGLSKKGLIGVVISVVIASITLTAFAAPTQSKGESKVASETTTEEMTSAVQEISEVSSETIENTSKETIVGTTKHRNTRNNEKLSHDGEEFEVSMVSSENGTVTVANSPIAKNIGKENTITETIVTTTVPHIVDNSNVKPCYPLYQCEKPKNEIVKAISNDEIYVGDSDFINLDNKSQQSIIDVLVAGYPNNTYGVGNTKAFEATYAALMFAGFGEVYSGNDEAIKYAYNEIVKHIGDNASQSQINKETKAILFDSVEYQVVNF